jgi:putative heme iron utilization protein
VSPRLAALIDLLHRVPLAALATQSARLAGYPFASAVAFAPDEGHRPVLLVSRLAEHSRNLEQDSRASLMLVRPLDGGELARATLVGEIAPCPATPELIARYLRFQPDARRLLELGDFGFVRLDARRIQVIGGFAQAGWIEGSALTDLPHFAPETEARLRAALASGLPSDWALLGVDPLGADLASPDGRERIDFGGGPLDPEAFPAAFAQSLRSGRWPPGP